MRKCIKDYSHSHSSLEKIMKNLSKLLFILSFCMMLMSCAATNVLDARYDIEETINGPDVADIIVVPTFSQDNIMVQSGYNFTDNKGTYCYDIAITNNTDDVLYVNWEKSAIYYNGISSYVMINNQSYFDRNDPMPSMMVPPRGTAMRSIISSDQPHYQPEANWGAMPWLVRVLPTFETQLILCVESVEGETYYIFNISGEEVSE